MPAITSQETLLRAPLSTDVPALGRICFDAFGEINARHGYPSDMPTLEIATGLIGMVLSVPGMEGIVAEQNGEPVGAAFLWPDGPIGGIGPVIVDPKGQDANVGKRMMRWILERGDELGLEGQRLVQAAFHGRSMALYTKLGFDVKEPLVVMYGTPSGEVRGDREVRALGMEDLASATELCAKVHGVARSNETAGAIMRGEARGVFQGGRLTGYATSIGFMGHAVAETNDDLLALIATAEQISGPGLLLPTRNAELFRDLLDMGLRINCPMTLMSRGRYQEPQGAFLPSILY